MNIIKHELKANVKAFIFWSIGLFLLVFVGMIKYTGLESGGAEVNKLLESFPKVVQAMFGMVGLTITEISGYYAILVFYVMICIAIYAISLASSAIGRESVDKTYEFLYTKPQSRTYILGMKLLVGSFYLIAFSILNYIFSILSLSTLHLKTDITHEVFLFSISILLVGFMFYGLGAIVVVFIKQSERGFLYGNIVFIILFLIGIIYDMLEHVSWLRWFSPFKYFLPAEILNHHLNGMGVLIIVLFIVISFSATFIIFNRKDFKATA